MPQKYMTPEDLEASQLAARVYANWLKAQSAGERNDVETALASYPPLVQQKFTEAVRNREKTRGRETDLWPMLGAAGGATKGLGAMAGRAASDFAVTRPQSQDALTALGRGMMAAPLAIPATAIPRAASKMGAHQILGADNKMVGMTKPTGRPRIPGKGLVPMAILSAILGNDSRTDKQLEEEAMREVK